MNKLVGRPPAELYGDSHFAKKWLEQVTNLAGLVCTLFGEWYDAVVDGTVADVSKIRAGMAGLSSCRIPRNAEITHLAANTTNALTAGTFTVRLMKNGVTTGQEVTFAVGGVRYAAIAPVAFLAGDNISLRHDLTGATFATGASVIAASVWGHFVK